MKIQYAGKTLQLRWDYHFRFDNEDCFFEDSLGTKTPEVITYCFVETDATTPVIVGKGTAMCSPRDRHVKETARLVSLERACDDFGLSVGYDCKDVRREFFKAYYDRKR